MDQEFKPFNREKLREIVDFCEANPAKPTWDTTMVSRFILELSSSPANVLDLHTHQVRVAVAVVLDKTENQGQNATVEIVGIDKNVDKRAVYQAMFDAARELPLHGKSGFEMTFHQSLSWAPHFAQANGMKLYYRSVDMIHMNLDCPPADFSGISEAAPSDDRDVYDVLVSSFKSNPETSIPPFEDWKNSRAASTKIWIVREGGSISAFLSLLRTPHENPEIRTIGVREECRGRGLGKNLLCHALQFLRESGEHKCALGVAVANERALGLYKNVGFQIVEQYEAYRFQFPGH